MDESPSSRPPSAEAGSHASDHLPEETLVTTEVALDGASAHGPTFILHPATHADEAAEDAQDAGDAFPDEEAGREDADGPYLYKDNAGTEVAPARAPLSSRMTGADEEDAAVAEEDLPDQVHSDVRPRIDRTLEALDGEAYADELARAEEAQDEATHVAAVAAEHQQPSQGVQADVDQVEAESQATETAAADAADAARAAATASTEARRASARQSLTPTAAALTPPPNSAAATRTATTTRTTTTETHQTASDAAASASAAPPPTAPPVQSSQGTTTVVMTLDPMGCRTSLTLPVHRFQSESNGYRSVAPPPQVGDSDGHWVVIAKDLFEAIGRHLAVHPQSFHLFRNGERVRFMSTLFLDRDAAAAAEAATRAEPLWLSVVFPPDEDGAAAATEEEEESASAPSSSVPAHLASLQPSDTLIRCIYVRRSKPVIAPSTLVENRQRHGLTFDEIIRAVNDDAGAEADPSLMAAVSVVHVSGGAAKPFIGGFRDVRDHSRVLHHAATQLFMKDLNYSPFPEKPVAVEDMQSRQTQTWGTSRSCQTRRECCVQTPVTGVVLDTSCDLVVISRPYFSATSLLALRTQKVIILQKLYRQWKARAMRRELEDAEAEKQHRAEARQRAEEAAQLARDELERLRRSDPRSANDFERLKEELEVWQAQESAYVRADPSLSEEEKRAALLAITKQELKLLQELERHRRQAMLDGKDKQFDRTMEKMASAKLWGQVEVTTRESERARELMELYRSLAQPGVVSSSASAAQATAPGLTSSSSARGARSEADGEATGDGAAAAPLSRTTARLDILLHVKWTVKAFDSELTRELCQLIDREADLLHRGRKDASLVGLRQRIALLFKQFIEDPEHNPGMAEYTRSAVGRLKARTLYGTVYNDDGSPVPGTTLVKPAAAKDSTKKDGSTAPAGNGASLYSRSRTY